MRRMLRSSSVFRTLLTGAVVITAAVAAGCGQDDEPEAPVVGPPSAVSDPGPIHVHGLGINPKDGALFIATHTGLFRAPAGETKATRVANRSQDTMGFTVVGPDHFLGSGHPDLREKLPPFLGLIESRDAGNAWRPVSRLGQSDFHVLEAAGRHVYGSGSNFRTRAPEFLVSSDAGRSWRAAEPPEQIVSLAIDPTDARRVVASGAKGLFVSEDAGKSWTTIQGSAGLLTWPGSDALYVMALDGQVQRSADGGRSWRTTGRVSGEPAAFDAAGADELYGALHDGTILRSADGGRTWSIRSRPS
jgi:hypothetical protein